MGRKILHGDPSDADFREKNEQDHSVELVMLTRPNLQANLDALEQLQYSTFIPKPVPDLPSRLDAKANLMKPTWLA